MIAVQIILYRILRYEQQVLDLMPDPGFKTITFRNSILERANAAKERSDQTKGMQLGPFIMSLVDEAISYREVIKECGPLQFISVEGDSVFVKDRGTRKIAELQIEKDGSLFCVIDEKKDCVHVGFALAIPQVHRAILNARKGTKRLATVSTP